MKNKILNLFFIVSFLISNNSYAANPTGWRAAIHYPLATVGSILVLGGTVVTIQQNIVNGGPFETNVYYLNSTDVTTQTFLRPVVEKYKSLESSFLESSSPLNLTIDEGIFAGYRFQVNEQGLAQLYSPNGQLVASRLISEDGSEEWPEGSTISLKQVRTDLLLSSLGVGFFAFAILTQKLGWIQWVSTKQ